MFFAQSPGCMAFGVAARRFAIRLCSLVKVLGTGIPLDCVFFAQSPGYMAFGVAARRFAIRLCSLVKVLGTCRHSIRLCVFCSKSWMHGIRSSSEAVCY